MPPESPIPGMVEVEACNHVWVKKKIKDPKIISQWVKDNPTMAHWGKRPIALMSVKCEKCKRYRK